MVHRVLCLRVIDVRLHGPILAVHGKKVVRGYDIFTDGIGHILCNAMLNCREKCIVMNDPPPERFVLSPKCTLRVFSEFENAITDAPLRCVVKYGNPLRCEFVRCSKWMYNTLNRCARFWTMFGYLVNRVQETTVIPIEVYKGHVSPEKLPLNMQQWVLYTPCRY